MDTHPGAADYLLRATGCAEAQEAREKELERLALEGDAVAYYVAAERDGEAPGQWHGQASRWFGFLPGDTAKADDVRMLLGKLCNPVTGESLGKGPKNFATREELLAARLTREPDATEERKRELYNEITRDKQTARGFFDFTFSASKSVSILHAALRAAGEDGKAAAVAEAHRAAITAAMSYAESEACWTRRGKHKQVEGRSVGTFEPGQGFAEARFDHSTSRARDPHLHTHVAVVNKTRGVDGKWLALHSAAFWQKKPVIAAIYESELERGVRAATGARFATRADGLGREVLGFTEADLAASSTRTRETLAAQAEAVEAFVARYNRQPSPAELRTMHRQAGLESRAGKTHKTPAEQLDEWAERDDVDPLALIRKVERAAAAAPVQAGEVDKNALVGRALAEVQARSASWTRGELIAQVQVFLGDYALPAATSSPAGLAQAWADEALQRGNPHGCVDISRPDPGTVPGWWRDERGRAIFRDPATGKYALASHMSTERGLVAEARRSGARALSAEQLREVEAELQGRARPLSTDQREAVLGVLGSGRAADVVVAAAGTGKSYTASVLAELWETQVGGRVLGVATSQKAAQVLDEDGLDSLNSTQFFLAYDPERGAPSARLSNRDLLVVDEANMSQTGELARIQQVAARAGAKIVYQGDPEQLSPVGAGGALELLARDNGSYELSTVHRFTAEWERDASLRLRAGDTSALDLYENHGRIRGGTADEMRDQAVLGYVADRLAGSSSLLVVQSNEQAAEVSQAVQDRMVAVGAVDRSRVFGSTRDGNTIYRGDVVQARRNDRGAATSSDAGMVANRDMFTVEGVAADGTVLARRVDEPEVTAAFSAAYVAEHVTLGYAGTEHAAEGMSVDTCHALTPGYVAMTRGRESNVLYVETQRQGDAEEQHLDLSAREVCEQRFSWSGRESSAVQQWRDEIAASRSAATVAHVFDQVQAQDAEYRHSDLLLGEVGPDLADRIDLEDGREGLFTALRRAELRGHDVAEVLHQAVSLYHLGGCDDLAAVLRARLDRVTSRVESQTETCWSQRGQAPEGVRGDFQRELAGMLDERRAELGAACAAEPPRWAVELIGQVPEAGEQREEWQARAGRIAVYRESQRVPEAHVSIGAAPNADDVAARLAWEDAARASNRPTDALDYTVRSDAELQQVVAQWEREQAWAPRYVAYEQGKAYEAAQRQRAEAEVLRAQSATSDDAAPVVEQAERAERIAARMAERAGLLTEAAEVRAAWDAHTEPSRDAAGQARDELQRRGHGRTEQPVEVEQAALFDMVDEVEAEGGEAEPKQTVEAATSTDEQAALFDVEATAGQQARRESAEITVDALEAEPTAVETESLADVVRRAEIAAQLMRQRTQARAAAEADEQARAERMRRDDERAAEQQDREVHAEVDAGEGMSV